MKKLLAFIFILFICLPVFSENMKESSSDKEPDLGNKIRLVKEQGKDIARVWKTLNSALRDKNIANESKVLLVEEFLKIYPENNKYKKEAQLIIEQLKTSDQTTFHHFLNRNYYWEGTEWFAISFAAGNYGFGGNISFFTVRWKHFYWEILRFQGVASFYGMSVVGKTLFGVPVFLTSDQRHELRFGSGFSGGFSYNLLVDSVALLQIPIEISYVRHIKRHFSFQTGLSSDFPVYFVGFFPIINIFVGIRI